MLTLESVVRQNPDQIATEVNGEVLMMGIDSGNYFGLNEVGSFIWRRLESPISVHDLCVAIQTEFDVTDQRCEADTLAYLDELVRNGLIHKE